VVRSSLDNLRLSTLPDEARVYIERAQLGLNRLTHILTRMTEATRLEQSLGDATRERFDLGKVVTGSVDGYRIAYPTKQFVLETSGDEMPVLGAPELIAQMLDKLVANAVEFANSEAPIVVELARIHTETGTQVRLAVENEGPALPAAMHGRLFDSMVSVRDKHANDEPHLGLGLFHGCSCDPGGLGWGRVAERRLLRGSAHGPRHDRAGAWNRGPL
jgi:signal transduction histidine kinase